ncbi:MAG: peptidoglycan bridge formation glycyltransferase FemA/FemB family protein [Anaerolineae bacterium]|nr:peptidoglycan bridge formation glycyltransferase FemA/FemB family protein [Anaerolineae bacterium]
MLTTTPITHRDEWNALLRSLPYAHILQTWEWGEFKRQTTGWQPRRLMFKQADQLVALASIGVRSVGPLKIMYAPKGPVFASDDPATWSLVLDHLAQMARRERVIWLKIDPDVALATGTPGEADDQAEAAGTALVGALKARGWRFSADQIQFRNTILIDLQRSEDDILAAMSQNTRRKIRIAEREGVRVRAGTTADLPILYDLYRITAARDGFLIRPPSYYELEWRALMEQGLAHALIAEIDEQPVGHVILFHFGRKCWYFTGASSNEQRDKMPNYLLQWEAMRWAKAQGYALYDMWGAPTNFDESDPLWGVYGFKRGFRGVVTRYVGAWDYAPSDLLYRLYTDAMPRVRRWLRRK